MAGSYLPLVGGNNIVSISDSAVVPVAFAPATINGVQAQGRAGSLKTSLLVALNGSFKPDLPLVAGSLLTLTLACPPGFLAPASAGLVGYDYSELLVNASGSLIGTGFVAAAGAWPDNFTLFATGSHLLPTNVSQLTLSAFAVAAPSADYQYGTITYLIGGQSSTAPAADALLSLSFDFGASITN